MRIKNKCTMKVGGENQTKKSGAIVEGFGCIWSKPSLERRKGQTTVYI